jgi:hypothetical protein
VPPRKFPAASSSERSTFVGLSSTPPKVTNKRCQRNPSPSVFWRRKNATSWFQFHKTFFLHCWRRGQIS